MLTAEIKQIINNARDILVGKVPDPKSQVDLITISMIYKFMDDMDIAGQRRVFFVNDLEQYAFSKIMDSRIGAQQRLNLFAEALDKLPFTESVPDLFRRIFRGAFLPFRDPNTLTMFLREIAKFSYDNSENLGNAFEYLLSIMGSQGDAGQFRTPRHIIDFIVDVVQPNKDDTILDPACGTAGFLISAYLYIKKNNPEMSAMEIRKLTENITGYDISPDMVKLATVNMYLHRFNQPKIYEYDSLSDDTRWGDGFDCILANPPFMTPKGGILPHNKFRVNANKAEVLFVDYIAEHLNMNGRAGIVVPEGIIFQAANAYKVLRKMLIDDNYLYAVVSLPSGVFNPYSGVKTSILFFDRKLAKEKKDILFIRVDNDGFDLGAKRNPIKQNDLPFALETIEKWKKGENVCGDERVTIVSKEDIGKNDSYDLTVSRYTQNECVVECKYPIVKLGEVADIDWGNTNLTKEAYVQNGSYLGVSAAGCDGLMEHFEHEVGVTVLSAIGANCGKIFYPDKRFTAIKNTITFTPDRNKVLPKYLFFIMQNNNIPKRGGAQPFMAKKDVCDYEIPLPPMDVQKQIVAEIENKQSAIDNAREIIRNLERESSYFASLLDGLDYEMVRLGDLCETTAGGTPLKQKAEYYENGDIPWIRSGEVSQGEITKSELCISKLGLENSSAKMLPVDTILVAMYGATAGQVGILKFEATTNQAVCGILPNDKVNPYFLYYLLRSKRDYIISLSVGGAQPNISQKTIQNLEIPLPSLKDQQRIVEILDREQSTINSLKALIGHLTDKINAVIARIYKQ